MSDLPQIASSRLTITQIKLGFELMLSRALAVKPNDELLLVIFDETFRPYVEGFSQVVVDQDIQADFKFLPLLYQQHLTTKINAQKLPRNLQLSFDQPSVVLCFLSGWRDGQPLRREIVDYFRRYTTCRLAHVPGLSDEILETVSQTDFDSVLGDCELVAWVLGNGEHAELETKDSLGNRYLLSMDLGGWNNEPLMSPGIIEQGSWGNFPPAETFCCPRRDLVNGKICIDGSIPGMVLEPGEEIVLEFISGRLFQWHAPRNGESRAVRFFDNEKRKAGLSGDANWNSFCELGVGLNHAIKQLTGNSLFDEKIAKTMHIAIGGNQVFGHPIKSDVHFDLITKCPDMRIDGAEVIVNGEVLSGELRRRRQSWRPAPVEITEDKMIRVNSSEVTNLNNILFRRLQSGGRVGHVAMADTNVATQLAALFLQLGEEPIRYGDLIKQAPPEGPCGIAELVAYLWHYRTLLIS